MLISTWMDLKSIIAERDWNDAMLFIANIRRYDSSLTVHKAIALYLSNKAIAECHAKLDLVSLYNLPFTPDDDWEKVLEVPSLILGFHFGEFRKLPVQLMAAGIPICMLIARSVYEQHVQLFSFLMNNKRKGHITFVEAEDPNLFYKLKQFRSRGYWIWAYLDGAKGVHASASLKDNKVTDVSLGSTSLKIRTGITDIAYLLKIPVFTMIEGHTPPLISRTADFASRKIFSENTIRQSMGLLVSRIKVQPANWECWCYLHEDLLNKSSIDDVVTEPRYLLIEKQGLSFLLDSWSYRLIPISEKQKQQYLRTTFVE